MRILKDEIVLKDDAKAVKVLAEPSFKIIGLEFKKSQDLEKHTTPTKAFLIVQSGEIEFSINGTAHLMSAGSFFEIPKNVEHEVRAIKDSYLYLIK